MGTLRFTCPGKDQLLREQHMVMLNTIRSQRVELQRSLEAAGGFISSSFSRVDQLIQPLA